MNIRLQLGCCGRELAAPVASLIQQLPRITQSFIDFSQASANLLGFKLKQAVASCACIAFRVKFHQLARNLLVLRLSLQLLGARRFDLRLQRTDPL